jgi:hypothetical protein
VWLEIRREATRGSVIGFVAFYVLAASLFAVLMASTFSTEIYLEAAYLMMPLLFAPYAARLVTRDRERGYSAVASVNPLTRAEETLARLLFLAALVVVTLGLTGPVTAFVAPPGGAAFEARALQLFGWGFFVAACSALAGLAIGAIAIEKGAIAVGAGAAWAFLQLFVSQNLSDIVDLGFPAGFVRVLHLSPPLWGLEATSPKYAAFAAFPVGAVPGALAVLALHAAAYLLVLALQDRQGWALRRRSSASVPLAAILVLALLAGSVVAAPAKSGDAPSFRDYYYGLPAKFEGGNVTLRFQTEAGESLFDKDTATARVVNLTRGESALAVLTFRTTAPNATLQLGPPAGESPYVDVGPLPPLPPSVTTDATGQAQVKLPTRPVPVILFGPVAPLRFAFTVNGEIVRPASYFEYGDADEIDLENVPQWPGALVAGLVPSLAIAPLAVWLPRRLNAWP